MVNLARIGSIGRIAFSLSGNALNTMKTPGWLSMNLLNTNQYNEWPKTNDAQDTVLCKYML